MQKYIPPGDTLYNGKIKSQWREFEFMLHQVQQVIEPEISLKETLIKWREISKRLSENARHRKLQITNYRFS